MPRTYTNRKDIAKIPEESGVYFLYQDGNILVYIGKAKSIRSRILAHDKDKTFSLISYELTHYSRARTRESELIDLYKREHGQLPYYNKQS
jgi:excinuclease UvrABC nuclease subunit